MQDAVYIELAGSHADEEKANQLVSSLISARHPLDLKMRHAEMTLTDGGIPLLDGEGVSGEHVRRAVPEEGGDSGGEGDRETRSESDREVMEDGDSLGQGSGKPFMSSQCISGGMWSIQSVVVWCLLQWSSGS